jgi:N-acetylmuramoyl-L-alanine amidase
LLPVFGGGSRDIQLILWEMAQARYIEQSAALARLVEQELRQRVPMSSRAIQQAPFRVLVGANMPAVLIELGFITNTAQEKALSSDGFQQQLVQALVAAVARYRDEVAGTPDARSGSVR